MRASTSWVELHRGAVHLRVYWSEGAACRAEALPPPPQGATRFGCISDTHGKTMQFVEDAHRPNSGTTLAPVHVLLHGGDFTSTGTVKQVEDFDKFMASAPLLGGGGSTPKEQRVCIAGNHDITFDSLYYEAKWARFHTKKAPSEFNKAASLPSCTYLEDSPFICQGGWKIWGSPWQPEFCDWAFNLDRGEPLRLKWDLIPQGTDILLTHGPPAGGFGGVVKMGGLDAGCEELTKAIHRVKPLVHVYGHIHEGYGVYLNGETVCINASSVDFSYKGVHCPIIFDLWRDEEGNNGNTCI